MARHAVEALSPRTRVLVNGRWDLCQLSDADGVHLPAAGLPVPAVRRALGEAALIGRSTHSLDEIRVARAEGADYVTFGPVYATPGKEAFGAPQGLDRLEQAAQLGLPVVALGGITTIERIRDCVAVGACGIAGIRIFADGDRAAECVAAIREAIGARR